jgi:hypothetical protein
MGRPIRRGEREALTLPLHHLVVTLNRIKLQDCSKLSTILTLQLYTCLLWFQ